MGECWGVAKLPCHMERKRAVLFLWKPPEMVVFTAVLFESLQKAKLSMCEITTFSANYKDNALKLNLTS